MVCVAGDECRAQEAAPFPEWRRSLPLGTADGVRDELCGRCCASPRGRTRWS